MVEGTHILCKNIKEQFSFMLHLIEFDRIDEL